MKATRVCGSPRFLHGLWIPGGASALAEDVAATAASGSMSGRDDAELVWKHGRVKGTVHGAASRGVLAATLGKIRIAFNPILLVHIQVLLPTSTCYFEAIPFRSSSNIIIYLRTHMSIFDVGVRISCYVPSNRRVLSSLFCLHNTILIKSRNRFIDFSIHFIYFLPFPSYSIIIT